MMYAAGVFSLDQDQAQQNGGRRDSFIVTGPPGMPELVQTNVPSHRPRVTVSAIFRGHVTWKSELAGVALCSFALFAALALHLGQDANWDLLDLPPRAVPYPTVELLSPPISGPGADLLPG